MCSKCDEAWERVEEGNSQMQGGEGNMNEIKVTVFKNKKTGETATTIPILEINDWEKIGEIDKAHLEGNIKRR